MFLAPKFFWGSAPEFLESIYKIDTGSDHVAKFRGNRQRDFGERVAKEKKTSLDGHGRARREDARRSKSEWKVNLDIRNSSRSSASKRLQKLYPRTAWRMEMRQLTVYEHFGCVNICAHTFFVCGPKFTTSPRKLW